MATPYLKKMFDQKDFVLDAVNYGVRILFILESPGNNEVKSKNPAVGKSGKDMTRLLLQKTNDNPIIGIGNLIKNENNELNTLSDEDKNFVKQLGVMNVCNYPMQHRLSTDVLRNSVIFKRISKKQDKYVKGESSEKLQQLHDEIINDFKARLLTAIDNGVEYIIPCGTFARVVIEQLISKGDIEEIPYPSWAENIPHPARNQWFPQDNEKNKSRLGIIQNMLNEIKLIIDNG